VARAGYQQLFMATMLLQAETKKAFGAEYARSYIQIMTGFLNDDHDHSDSISSMSVQLFTVPTLVSWLKKVFFFQFLYDSIFYHSCVYCLFVLNVFVALQLNYAVFDVFFASIDHSWIIESLV